MSNMDDILKALQRLENEAATARQHREMQQRNIEQFWAKDWRGLVERIDAIARSQDHMESRIRNLEVMMHGTPERISKLEGKCDSMEKRQQSFAIAMVVIGVLAVGNIGSKLALFF